MATSAISGPPTCTCDPLHKIPWEILKEMKEVAGYYGWVHANRIQNKDEQAEKDFKTMEHHYELFEEFGLPTPPVCAMFRDMADYCGKSTAEERSGDGKVAAEYKAKSIDKQKEMVASGEISAELAEKLWELCWYSGWRAANSKKFFGLGLFHKDDAANDEKEIERLYQLIGDHCVLKKLLFFGDAAELVDPKKPNFFASQKLQNKSDFDQQMSATFSHYKTVTKSMSTTIKWKYTIAGAVGAAYFAAGGIAGSISYSKSTTEGLSTTDGETQTVTFPINVGPHCELEAKGVVQECEARIPYFMVFEIGGKTFCKEGKWTGIMASNIDYQIGENRPLD